MTDSNAHVRQQLLNHRRAHEDRIDTIVNKVHLAATAEFLFNRGLDQVGVEMRNNGVDRKAVLRRGLDDGHIANTEQ